MEGLKTPEQYSRGGSDSPKDAILKTSFIELMGNQPIVPKIALTLPVEEVASVQDFHQMTADLSPAMAGLPNASVLAQIRSVFQKFSSTDILDGGHEVDLDSSPPDFGLAELHRVGFTSFRNLFQSRNSL